jgi:hypothetical protein
VFLSNGPRLAREVWAAAQEQHLSARTLDRARNELDIRSLRVWQEGVQVHYWLLPGQHLPGDDPEFDAELEALRQEYPPPSPLDDMEE